MRILVAVDGSAHSLHAAAFVMRHLRPLPGAEAHVVNVQPPVPYLEALSEAARASVDAAIAKQGDETCERVRQMLEAAGFVVRVHVETGDPAEAIVRCARECGCDLVVMGTRGLGAVEGWALGSVASRVLRRVDIPVALVR
jgi:nucleotide-binding universal stress UspA family protein